MCVTSDVMCMCVCMYVCMYAFGEMMTRWDCDGAAARVCVTVTEVSQHNTPRVASKVAMARRHVCV